jgi:hypothetical protein
LPQKSALPLNAFLASSVTRLGIGAKRRSTTSRSRRKPTAKSELAEILVLRKQDPRLAHSKVKNILVSNRWAFLGNPQHVMAKQAQHIDRDARKILVGQQPHRTA